MNAPGKFIKVRQRNGVGMLFLLDSSYIILTLNALLSVGMLIKRICNGVMKKRL